MRFFYTDAVNTFFNPLNGRPHITGEFKNRRKTQQSRFGLQSAPSNVIGLRKRPDSLGACIYYTLAILKKIIAKLTLPTKNRL